MKPTTQAARSTCMGGWCTRRDRCQHHRPGELDEDPAERLCQPRRFNAFAPVMWAQTAQQPLREAA